MIEYLNEKKSGGTNIHAGLLEAKRLLDEDQGVLPQNKHVVLISDGLTYLYCKNDDPSVGYTRTFGTNAGTLYDWSARFGIGQNDQAMTKVLFKDDGKEYTYNSIQENATNFAKYMNHYKDDVEYSKYDGVFHKDEANINIDPDTPEMPHSNDPNIAPSEDVMKMPSNLWVAFKRADETWQDMKNEDYNLHVFADNANATGIGKCFLQYLNRSDNSDIQTFDPDYLQRSVLQIVDKGSTLVDTIGKHFNFVNNPKNISLQIGQDTFNAEKIDGKENEYKFGDKATLKYMPGDNESITLTLNTALTPQTYASLKYSVKLDKDSNLPTEAGTHKLATNESAVLKAVDGNNKPHGQFVFKSPEVDYSVSRPCPKPCPEPEPAKPDVIPYVASDPTEPVVTEVEEPKVGKVAKTGELAGVSSELGLVVLLVAGMIANKRKH